VKGYAGLCRESPFTALASEAIFAVTDDFLNRVITCAGVGWLSGSPGPEPPTKNRRCNFFISFEF